MNRLLLFLLILCSTTAHAQTDTTFSKTCSFSAGLEISNPERNALTLGNNLYVQLAYQIFPKISVATEFEMLRYTQPGYYKEITVDPNEVKVYDNNFSLLLKYDLVSKRKIKLTASTGWTFMTRQREYYFLYYSYSNPNWVKNTTSISDFHIPMLAELTYPIDQTYHLQVRAKYNFNPENGTTYSVGTGLSVKL